MIWYFREGLRTSIRVQLNAWGQELDSWKEAIEKAINAKVKALLQPPLSIYKINSKCLQGHKPAKEEEFGKN